MSIGEMSQLSGPISMVDDHQEAEVPLPVLQQSSAVPATDVEICLLEARAGFRTPLGPLEPAVAAERQAAAEREAATRQAATREAEAAREEATRQAATREAEAARQAEAEPPSRQGTGRGIGCGGRGRGRSGRGGRGVEQQEEVMQQQQETPREQQAPMMQPDGDMRVSLLQPTTPATAASARVRALPASLGGGRVTYNGGSGGSPPVDRPADCDDPGDGASPHFPLRRGPLPRDAADDDDSRGSSQQMPSPDPQQQPASASLESPQQPDGQSDLLRAQLPALAGRVPACFAPYLTADSGSGDAHTATHTHGGAAGAGSAPMPGVPSQQMGSPMASSSPTAIAGLPQPMMPQMGAAPQPPMGGAQMPPMGGVGGSGRAGGVGQGGQGGGGGGGGGGSGRQQVSGGPSLNGFGSGGIWIQDGRMHVQIANQRCHPCLPPRGSLIDFASDASGAAWMNQAGFRSYAMRCPLRGCAYQQRRPNRSSQAVPAGHFLVREDATCQQFSTCWQQHVEWHASQ